MCKPQRAIPHQGIETTGPARRSRGIRHRPTLGQQPLGQRLSQTESTRALRNAMPAGFAQPADTKQRAIRGVPGASSVIRARHDAGCSLHSQKGCRELPLLPTAGPPCPPGHRHHLSAVLLCQCRTRGVGDAIPPGLPQRWSHCLLPLAACSRCPGAGQRPLPPRGTDEPDRRDTIILNTVVLHVQIHPWP